MWRFWLPLYNFVQKIHVRQTNLRAFHFEFDYCIQRDGLLHGVSLESNWAGWQQPMRLNQLCLTADTALQQ